MADPAELDRRLAAVERAVVDDERPVSDVASMATLEGTVSRLEGLVTDHERRLAELEAADRSLEGFVDSVHHVNDDVERRANAALAAVDRLESRLVEVEAALEGEHGTDPRQADGAMSEIVEAEETIPSQPASGPARDAGPGRDDPASQTDGSPPTTSGRPEGPESPAEAAHTPAVAREREVERTVEAIVGGDAVGGGVDESPASDPGSPPATLDGLERAPSGEANQDAVDASFGGGGPTGPGGTTTDSPAEPTLDAGSDSERDTSHRRRAVVSPGLLERLRARLP